MFSGSAHMVKEQKQKQKQQEQQEDSIYGSRILF